MDRLAAIVGKSSTPRADVALALSVGGFAALLLWEADKIPPPFFDPLGSAALPNAIALVMAVLATIVLLRAVAAHPFPALVRPTDYRPRPDIALGIVILALAYVAAMEYGVLGFRAATVLFVALACALLGRLQPRIALVGVLVALVVGFGGAYIFTNVFFIALP
ncbi:MAG: hypothetical protein AcusKO_37770 [Acuticoccus sp.]